jgi:hypothetical protein
VRRCGRERHALQGEEAVGRRRHRPRFDVPVLSQGRPTRERCPSCPGTSTTTPRGAWDEPRRPNTTADEPEALRLVSNATVTAAAHSLGGEGVLGTLDRRRDEIAHDCPGRPTSGFVQRVNTRVTGLKRRGDGIVDVGRRFPRLTLDLSGDQLFGHP